MVFIRSLSLFSMSTFELQSRARIARTLGPTLALVLVTTLAACTPAAPTGESSSSSVPAMEQSSTSHTYKDGSYSATGVYRSPAGGEQVNVSMTLDDDTVTSVSFTGTATHPKSKAMQKAFSEGFIQQVVGKSLDEVNVGVVNGSSLTGIGFMDAVAKIKAEAKS